MHVFFARGRRPIQEDDIVKDLRETLPAFAMKRRQQPCKRHADFEKNFKTKTDRVSGRVGA